MLYAIKCQIDKCFYAVSPITDCGKMSSKSS